MSNINSRNGGGRVRTATLADVPAIERLARRAQRADGIPRFAATEITELVTRGNVIVLGLEPDELVAAACITVTNGRGHLAFAIVEPNAPEIEARIVGVAAALCESLRAARAFAGLSVAA